MNRDISSVLRNWKFDPEDICARKIRGGDGREKLQVRLDLGLLQMELSGRPDGTRPYGYESALSYHLEQLEIHRKTAGSDEDFELDEDACAELWQESLQYYHRYICLLKLQDFDGVIQDTAHNLAIFNLVKDVVEDEESRISFEQYRPYVVMIHTRAKGELCLVNDNYEGALAAVEAGMAQIRGFFESFGDPDLVDSSEELQALEAWAEEIRRERPVSVKQRLSEQLAEAIAEEKYELAARLRDRLRGLESTSF